MIAEWQPGRQCLVLSQWTAHVEKFASLFRDAGLDPVVLRGGMGAKERKAALARLQPSPEGTPLLVVATGPYVGEGFDCPALDILFLASSLAKRAPGYVSLGFPDPRTSLG